MKKLCTSSIVLVLCILGWGGISFEEQAPVPRGTIRIVDKHPANWEWIMFSSLEHLIEFDRNGRLVPRLATSWRWLNNRTLEVTLRQGVIFHNGERFDAEIVKLNWEENIRFQQRFRGDGVANFKQGSRLEIVDPQTVRLLFPEPDEGALVKLSFMPIANRQFYHDLCSKEKHGCMVESAGPWGTGPYKLVEGFSTPDKRSDQVVLEANIDYWDKNRFPRLKRIVFDNILDQNEAVELVKTGEGRVDLVSELSPLETLGVARSPFAKVVKNRQALVTIFGQFNMRKTGSPWNDVRLRQAVNFAINREDLIRYAAKGNGVISPALVPVQASGYGSDSFPVSPGSESGEVIEMPAFKSEPDLVPYPFDPAKAHHLLREAGYPNGLLINLIAPKYLSIQATVVSKMLEHNGFRVERQILDSVAYTRKTLLSHLDQPPEKQQWDIALTSFHDLRNFSVFQLYHFFALDGPGDWVIEEPELRQFYEQLLRNVDREDKQGLIRQMERYTLEQAYFLFLYNPIQLYAANKAVEFVPFGSRILSLAEISVTDRHWSVRRTIIE